MNDEALAQKDQASAPEPTALLRLRLKHSLFVLIAEG
jgi:hypothetical protein